MPITHIFEMNEIIPTSRTTTNSGRPVDRMYVTAKLGVTTLVTADSSGLQYQV